MKVTEGRVRVAASDVANFLACQQLTQLDLQAARRTLRPPYAVDLGFEDLVRRGEEHERAVLERFRADGREVADLGEAGDPAGATAAAIQGGAEVVYQGTLTGAGGGMTLFGRPDFLVRADLLPAPDGDPRPAGRHYEVVDAKLARTAKARAVLQTAFYSHLLAGLQDESYSIKRLEPLCGYDRRVDLEEATVSLIALEAALEGGTAAGDAERQQVVAGYNEDDCRATLALRDWLEEQRVELAGRLGEGLPRPVFAEKPGTPEDPEVARIRSALLAGVSAETPDGQARTLLADLIDWHRREDKPAWWRYFYLRTLSRAELTGEPDALGGLSGGEVVGQVKKSVVRRFRFPAQEHKFSAGGAACDPATDKQWPVCDVDDARGTIDLKVGSTYAGPWPAALIEAGPPRTWEQRDRLRDLGDRVVRTGFGGGDMATALLLRRRPDDGDDAVGSLRAEGETASAAAIRLAVSLRHSYLPMQGPPETGKTYTAAEQILELITQGRTVGITGPSHAVICHLIDTVYEHARSRGAGPLRIGQRADRDNPHLHADATTMSNQQLEKALRDGELDVAAGTAWLWARSALAGSVDTLFVDEAGQMSLANVLAIQRALAASGQAGFRVGTVDKFQGQEAPAVIYSMATSSADEAPRGLDFLYDPHRLNVATSRARALAIIVASPDLTRVSCRTPHHMVLANALCRAWETGG
jgi:hypothetical protein